MPQKPFVAHPPFQPDVENVAPEPGKLVVEDGVIRNPNFTDYLLPTILDAPEVEALLIEEDGSWGPFGAKGVGEPPTISSTAAVVAAIRAASGRELSRVPVRPQDIAL